MSIEQLVKDHIDELKNTDLAQLIASGRVGPEFYAMFLWNQLKRYEIMEDWAKTGNLYDGLDDLRQRDALRDDFESVWKGILNKKRPPSVWLQSSLDHGKRMKMCVYDDNIDSSKLFAHMYVLHAEQRMFASLVKELPGSDNFIRVVDKSDILKTKVTADMEDDIKVACECSKGMFLEMWNVPDLNKFGG